MRDVFEIILCAMIALLGLFMTICPQKSLKDEKRGDPEAKKKGVRQMKHRRLSTHLL